MSSQYAQALEEQRRYAGWLASPEGVQAFYSLGADQMLMRKFYGSARLTLAAADPYYWAPEICELLESVSEEMPRWTLRREALPTAFGFCWFRSPLPVPEHQLWVQAIAWGISTPATVTATDPETLVVNVYGGDPRLPARFWPLLNLSWPFGDAFSAEDTDDESDTAKQRRGSRRVFRYAAAIFGLLEQRILVTTPLGIERSALRRLKKVKARQPPAILVVRLRRAQGTHGEPGEPVEWSCRWIVRGHWRQQYYPSSGEYRPIFILPHIKGPDDKPLRAPAERVFAVVR